MVRPYLCDGCSCRPAYACCAWRDLCHSLAGVENWTSRRSTWRPLSQASDGFSGAEIEQAVVSALYAAQARQVAVDQALLLGELHSSVPLSVLMAEDIQRLRHWAQERQVNAE